MFVTLTHAQGMMPVLVNLDQVLYAYRESGQEATVLVFGKVADPNAKPGSRLRKVAVTVDETLPQIQEKRRLGAG
ncbi:MAG: hypothetical protein AMK73_04490 [Planctomycetes bacterium SM23_32]|nr:MAG: hypothetical protein AMK73_04490 [Planctomycetes bacterium SM23_32]